MSVAALTLVAACTGALVVGPFLSHAALRWMGWRVTLPILLGYVPARADTGRSRVLCRRCEAPLSWTGRLPFLQWLGIRGRCRRCGEPVAAWALGVELATGLAFGLVAWRIGWSLTLVPVLVLSCGLVAASVVDLACWRIPSRFVYMTFLGAGLGIVLAAVQAGEPRSILGAGLGALMYFGLLAALFVASRGQFGLGDVRLGLVCGLVVGWMAWTTDLPVYGPLSGVLSAALISSLAGSIVGLVMLAVRRRMEPFPYGPWLSLGAFVAVLLAA